MKSLITFILFFTASAVASANVLLERELVNAYNGESYTCRINQDSTTEIINEGVSVLKVKIPFQTTSKKIQGWIKDMKADADFSKVKGDSKRGISSLKPQKITQYVHRGLKQYSLYDGGKKVVYYKLVGYLPKNNKSKPGSLEYKIQSRYKELRGQTDVVCKTALNQLK
jgi:hypothetical protein